MKDSIEFWIENELNKIFVSLGSKKWVRVAFILSLLDFSMFDNKGNFAKYPVEAILKLYVYKKVYFLCRVFSNV